MELHAVHTGGIVLECRDRAAFGARGRPETGGDGQHLIAMAHPHLIACKTANQTGALRAECLVLAYLQFDAGYSPIAVLLTLRFFDRAAQLERHELLAVTDSK